MKRNLFFFLSLLLIPLLGLQAQVSAYSYSSSIGTYSPITGGLALGSTTSDEQRIVDPALPIGGTVNTGPGLPIGFTFNYGGANFDKIGVNVNGWINLGNGTVTTPSGSNPVSSTTALNAMAPFARDLQSRVGGEVRIETIGTTPNQKCVIQWTNYKRWGTSYVSDTLNFQIVLNETSNTVQFVYGKCKTSATVTTADPIVGLKGSVTSNWLTLDGSFAALIAGAATTSNVDFNSTSAPVSGRTITFTPPSCIAPAALSATAITTNSANFGWTSTGTNINIRYGLQGITPATGTKARLTANTFAYSGLTPNTSYAFYVRDSCSASAQSAWAGPFVFKTLCAALNTFPWLETFDATTTTIPSCWENETNDNADWIFRAGAIGHGSTVDHTLGTSAGYYAGMDDSHGNIYDTVNNLLTPSFDITGLTTPRLNFWYFIGNDATLTSKLFIDVYDGTTWNMGVAKVTFTQAAWLNYNVDLTLYKSANTRIRFRGVETIDFNSDISIDDIKVEETPNCIAPTALTATAITSTSATLGWTTGGASNSKVQYGPTGFVLGTGTIVAATSTSLVVTGLLPNTTYQFYVKDSCNASSVSVYAGPFSFTTPCAPISTFPYVEGFEGATAGSPGVLPTCWTASSTTTYRWEVDVNGTTSSGTGPSVDNTLGTALGKYVYTEASNGATGNVAYLTLPVMNTTSLTTPQIEFYYHMFGSAITELALEAYNTSTTKWDTIFSLQGQQQTANNSPWQKGVVSLSSVSSNNLQLRFANSKGAGTFAYEGDVALDDITVGEQPACSTPTLLGAFALTSTGASVYWTTGGAANWKVQYGPTGFSLGTGTIVAASNDTLAITGLMANTTYQFYVKDSCSASAVSAYAGPFSFTTPCVVVGLPYVESWEATSTTAGCWTTQGSWALSTAVSAYGVGTNSVTFPFFSVSSGSFDANSPQFTPVPVGYQLAFDHAYATYATEIDSLKIFYSTDGGITYSLLVGLNGGANGSLTTAPPSLGSFAPTAAQWANYSISLPVGTNQLRFTAKTAFGNNLYLDNIAVQLAPVCPAPLALGAFGVAQTTANIHWTSTGTAFNVEYGPTGFNLGNGIHLSLVANDTTALSGLTAQTCYDFYVQTACASDSSVFVGPFNICTLPVPSACNVVNTALNDTLCAPGTAKFFSSTTNGLVRFNTSNLVTLSADTVRLAVTGTTSIQVAEVVNGTNRGHVGPLPTIAATGFGNFSNGQKITALDTVRIDSMTVRANGVVTAQVQIYTKDPAKGGVLLQTGSPFTTGAGADATYKVAVGTVLTPGSYFMNVSFISGTGMLFRSTGGAVYPYILPGLLRIDSTNFGTQNRLYYTFDLVVSEVCISPKKTVIAQLIGLNPGQGRSVVLCDNAPSVNLTSYLSANAAVGGSFKVGAASTAVTGTMLNPSLLAPGVYTIYYKTLGTVTCAADSSKFTFYIQNCSGCSTLVTPVTSNDTICGPGFATVSATGSNLLWYNPSDSVLVGGNTFTDSIGVNTTYNVVSAFSAGPAITLGPKVTTNSNAYPTANFTNGQYITVSKTVRIDSATFAVNGALNFVTVIWDAQRTTVLQQSKVISFAARDTAAKEIGVVLTPGVYFMNTAPISGTGVLYRMAAGGAFPYGIPGYFTADSSDFGPARYYYFNDMKVSSSCLSPAATAMAVVAAGFNAGASASDTVCDTLMVDLSTYLGTFDMGGTWVDVNATGALTGSMFNAYAVAKNATYTFRYEGGVGSCGDTATISLYVDYCSIGLNEFSKAGLIVYPNPTNGVVYVVSLRKNSQNMTVELFEMSGKQIFRKEFDGNQKAEMELSSLPDGIYNIKVTNDNGSSVHRIVKQ